jgi:hypothetical protein
MLGFVIGVAAVITIVALGSDARETIADSVEAAGTNLGNGVCTGSRAEGRRDGSD